PFVALYFFQALEGLEGSGCPGGLVDAPSFEVLHGLGGPRGGLGASVLQTDFRPISCPGDNGFGFDPWGGRDCLEIPGPQSHQMGEVPYLALRRPSVAEKPLCGRGAWGLRGPLSPGKGTEGFGSESIPDGRPLCP